MFILHHFLTLSNNHAQLKRNISNNEMNEVLNMYIFHSQNVLWFWQWNISFYFIYFKYTIYSKYMSDFSFKFISENIFWNKFFILTKISIYEFGPKHFFFLFSNPNQTKTNRNWSFILHDHKKLKVNNIYTGLDF